MTFHQKPLNTTSCQNYAEFGFFSIVYGRLISFHDIALKSILSVQHLLTVTFGQIQQFVKIMSNLVEIYSQMVYSMQVICFHYMQNNSARRNVFLKDYLSDSCYLKFI